MKFSPIISLLVLPGLLVLAGCGNTDGKEERLSTDLVKNPNTAGFENNSAKLPVLKFDEIEHDFGKIIDGESVSFEFKFTNSGKTDLIIVDVSTSCGCTVPSYPKTPVRPGEKGVVKVSFNSAGKRGFQAKNILVVANTQPNTTLLRIKAQVVGAKSNN